MSAKTIFVNQNRSYHERVKSVIHLLQIGAHFIFVVDLNDLFYDHISLQKLTFIRRIR